MVVDVLPPIRQSIPINIIKLLKIDRSGVGVIEADVPQCVEQRRFQIVLPLAVDEILCALSTVPAPPVGDLRDSV